MHPGSPSHPSGTAAAEAKPRCVYSILKPHGQSSRSPVRTMLSEATQSYVNSILKPHGQVPISEVVSHNVTNKSCFACVMNEKCALWIILRPIWFMRHAEANLPWQVDTPFSVSSPPQCRSQAVVCASTPRGTSQYFIINTLEIAIFCKNHESIIVPWK